MRRFSEIFAGLAVSGLMIAGGAAAPGPLRPGRAHTPSVRTDSSAGHPSGDSREPFSLQAQTREARIEYLKTHALAVRTIDARDTDFADLEPLRRIIGNRRVVMLGEATHGDGAALAAKTRLIKFLHERMGFDVLALEGGLYDVRRAWSSILAGEDPVAAMRSAVFEEWADARQAEPLWRYVADRAKSNRRLELAGFDVQFTGRASAENLVKDLIPFLTRTGMLAETSDLASRIAEPLQLLLTNTIAFQKIGREDRALILEAMGHLGRALERMPPGPPTAATERDFWIQALKSGAAMMEFAWAVDLEAFRKHIVDPAVFNMRDRQMAQNFLWLANRAYPERKIIVWSATGHIIRNRGSLEETRVALVPMGEWIDKAMGDEVYTLGFTAYRGRWGTPAMSRPQEIETAVENSLEDLMFKANFELAWLDFRNLESGGFWLRDPLSCRPLGYQSRTADWTRIMDGIFFIREMFPSTPIETKQSPAGSSSRSLISSGFRIYHARDDNAEGRGDRA